MLSYRRVVNSTGFAITSFGFGLLYNFAERWTFFIIGVLFIFTFLLSLVLKIKKEHNLEKQGKEVKRKPNFALFVALNVISVLSAILFNQYSTTYTLFLENFAGFTMLDISLLFTIHGIIVVVFQVPVGHLCDKITLSLGCFIGALLLAFGMGLTGLASSFALAIFFVYYGHLQR